MRTAALLALLALAAVLAGVMHRDALLRFAGAAEPQPIAAPGDAPGALDPTPYRDAVAAIEAVLYRDTAAAWGDPEAAAKLLGAGSCWGAFGWSLDAPRLARDLRTSLGERAYTQAYDRGRALDPG